MRRLSTDGSSASTWDRAKLANRSVQSARVFPGGGKVYLNEHRSESITDTDYFDLVLPDTDCAYRIQEMLRDIAIPDPLSKCLFVDVRVRFLVHPVEININQMRNIVGVNVQASISQYGIFN